MHDPKQTRNLALKLRWIGSGALLVALAIAATGIVSRNRSETALGAQTRAQAIPDVTLVSPGRGVDGQELVLPGQIEADYEAPIHARVGGYLKKWYRDIGAHVKKGDLLAEIDTPDLDQQLQQARADLASAQASAALADLTARRWQASVVASAVSQQTIDEKVGDAQARRAQAAAAEANVRRLEVLEGFKRVTAPFDGVVTARKTDIGALITASGDSGSELFSVADMRKVRVYVQIPQAYLADIRPGMTCSLQLPQFPGQTFRARLDTTSNAVDHDSRTVLAEFLADNADGRLWAGTYAEAHLQLPAAPAILRLPTSALLFRQEGLSVAVLDGHGKVELKRVTLGRDLGTSVEVVSGVSLTDRVIDNPPDSIAAGDTVRIQAAT